MRVCGRRLRKNKLQFMGNGEYEGLCPCPPHKGLLKKSLMNPQNFQKNIDMPSDLIVGSIEETPMGPLPHWYI